MSLISRLGSLERQVASLDLVPDCATCGGVRPRLSKRLIVMHGGEEPKRCSECNRMLDERGIPVAKKVKVIYLMNASS